MSRVDSGAFPPLPPVLIHMSMGLMILALTLCLILLSSMGLSFRPVFRRLTKIDLVFSFLSFGIGECRLGKGCSPRPSVFPPGSPSGFEVCLRASVLLSAGSVFESLWESLPHSFCVHLISLFSVFLSQGRSAG